LANRVDFYLNPTKGSLDIAMRNVAIYPVIKATPAVKHNQMSFWFNDTEIAGGRTQEDPLKGFSLPQKEVTMRKATITMIQAPSSFIMKGVLF
jgi:hypothetical protein